ncbi:hypothetical protein ABTX24_21490 [Nocardioides sp. NPDC127514]
MLPFLQRSRQVIWLKALGMALLASCERRHIDPVLDVRAQLLAWDTENRSRVIDAIRPCA